MKAMMPLKWASSLSTLSGIEYQCVGKASMALNSDCRSSLCRYHGIALFSYSQKELQRQLDILQAFCSARGLQVNVQKTTTMVFEDRKSQTPPFTYDGNGIE